MAEVKKSQFYVPQERRSFIGVVVTGFLVGVLSWLLSLGLQAWIIEPIFCRSEQSFDICANGGTIAWTASVIIVSFLGLLSMVRTNVFRPLLVVIATLIALWSVSAWLGPLEWWQAMLWHGLLFGLAYIVFAWVARIQNFLLSLVVTIILIILARLVVINS